MAGARATHPPRVYVARSTGVIRIGTRIHRYYEGRTVPSDSPLIKALPGSFELVDLDKAGIVIGPEVSEPEIRA